MNIRKIIFSLMVLILIPFAPLKAIGGFGLSANASTYSVESGSSALMVNGSEVGNFAYDGFENGYGLGGYLFLDIIPIVDLDLEYNFTGSLYNFTFENLVTTPEAQEFAFASGSMYFTVQKPVFGLGIPFLAKAKLFAGLGINETASTPLVNQEMLESVFGGASNLESGEYDYSAVITYLEENRVKTSGYHAQAGIFFKVLTFNGSVFYRYVMAKDAIPGNDGFGSLNFRLGLGI
jgi:hypothetical protein